MQTQKFRASESSPPIPVYRVDTNHPDCDRTERFFSHMADEIPPAPSESGNFDPTGSSKSETIRITLPPKNEQPSLKRETVRINVPSQPSPPPAATSKPFVPAPPSPPSAPALQPAGSSVPPPRPPSLSGKPTLPLKPSAPPSAGAPSPAGVAQAVVQKAAAPKKETARITLPDETPKPPLPKATVKIQQTQPLVNRAAVGATSVSLTQAITPVEPANDSILTVLSIAALVISIAALAATFVAFSGASSGL
jgi:hypothetical protein